MLILGWLSIVQFHHTTYRDRCSPKWTRTTIFVVSGVIALVLLCGIIATVVSLVGTSSTADDGIVFEASESLLGVYRYAAVATSAGKCSEAGTKMLAKGGSAVDAAIAATICIGSWNMHNAGVGGGFFMTYWDQTSQNSYVIDARESAPLSSSQDMFKRGNISSAMGPFSIAVPGEIAGYWAAHQRFGRVPWSWLFEPTIQQCRSGFAVPRALAVGIRVVLKRIAKQPNQKPFENMKKYLTSPKTRKAYKENDTMYCKKLADTLKRIADAGGPDIYNGSLASDILADLRDVGSPINETDLQKYTAIWRKPVSSALLGKYTLLGVPPPGSGALVSFILNILAGYNFTRESRHEPLSYHRIAEAFKFAYAKRSYLGDESFVDGLDAIIANLTSHVYARLIRSKIKDNATFPASHYDAAVTFSPDSQGTTQVSVIDGRGNAASLTSTINTYFGSGILGRRTGIVFNNEMDDFAKPNKTNHYKLSPSPNNFIKPEKRPQSSMAPTIILEPAGSNGTMKVSVAIGGAGGSRITSGTAYVAARMLLFKENVKEAIDALRIHHQLYPPILYYEKGMPKQLVDYLASFGHTVKRFNRLVMSSIHAVEVIDNKTLLANSDFRKGVIAYPDGF